MTVFLILDDMITKVLGHIELSSTFNVGEGMGGHSRAYELVLNAMKGVGPEQYVKQFKGIDCGFSVVRLAGCRGEEALVVPKNGPVFRSSLGTTGLANVREKCKDADSGENAPADKAGNTD